MNTIPHHHHRLAVKIASLSAEARVIRHRANRVCRLALRRNRYDDTQRGFRNDLNHHRRTVVRPETRCALLAKAFLRGRAYATVEHKCHERPDWERVHRIVQRFAHASADNSTSLDAVRAWAKHDAAMKRAA